MGAKHRAGLSPGSSNGLNDADKSCDVVPQFRHNHPRRRAVDLLSIRHAPIDGANGHDREKVDAGIAVTAAAA